MSNLVIIEKVQEVTVVRFCFNEINLHQNQEIKDQLQDLLDAGDRYFVFELSKIGFFSSLVIAIILSFVKASRAMDGNVKICCLSPEACAVFDLMKLDSIVEAFGTENDAIKSYGV